MIVNVNVFKCFYSHSKKILLLLHYVTKSIHREGSTKLFLNYLLSGAKKKDLVQLN